MTSSGGLVIMLSSFLCLFLFPFALINIILKQWWTPTRVQKLMGRQGIKGPSYRLVHGNAKQILDMKNEAMSRPKSLSHDLFPLVQPHYNLWCKIYGNIFLQWYGTVPQLVIMEPELCKEILNNKDRVYLQVELQGFSKKLLGNGLGTAEGEHWAKLRKVANHSFHGESLKNMIPDMITSVEEMLQRWKNHEGKEVEVNQEFMLLTSEVISKTAFGSSYVEGKNIFEMLTKLSSLLFKNVYTFRLLGISNLFKTSDEIEGDKIEKEVRRFILLEQETTNGLLAWTVFLLALHPDWQEEARKEVLQLFGKQNPNPDGIARLKTMSMIINETLRLYPPVVQLIRKTGREVRLGKHDCPC
ncbi:hypothetical protein M0R45_000995 [Rubus argutus]|uniref:Cytochrome P450 n=1 Tax=Rubus argutus TaxID=59490 RepID=A0AAW1VJB3_RUBAR